MTKFLENLIQRWDSRIGYSKSDPIKNIFKILAGSMNRGILSRFLSCSILRSEFENLENVFVYKEREIVLDKSLKIIDNASLTYIEFGVYEGSSISYGAKVEFIAQQLWRRYPIVVLCKIRPLNSSFT